MSMRRFGSCIAAVVLLAASFAIAEVKLPSILGDNMVLQQGQPVPIWGKADPGEKVTVRFMGQTKQATAGQDGAWRVDLDPLKATGKPQTLTIAGENTIELDNVLVGEVWVASGQSNMAWSVARSDNAEKEIAAAKYPNIRLITVPRKSIPEPQDDFEGEWVATTPETIPNFSAVAYFFGRELHNELDVPIGLINTSYGGTPSEAWTPRPALEAQPGLKPLLERWDKDVAAFDAKAAAAEHEKQLERWKEQAAKAKKAGKDAPRRPAAPADPGVSQHRPAGLYNGMIHPLLPVAIRGAIWYQGESNVPRAYQYRTIFPTMIQSWRDVWKQKGEAEEFPFYFVQIAPYDYRHDPEMGAELWEAQLMAMKNVPNSGMAVTTDIGNLKDIHPTNKQDVGHRLAIWALAKTYGRSDLPHSGPVYKTARFEDGKAIVTFDHVYVGLKSRDGKPLSHFLIAGKDKQFHPAEVKIDGDKLIVSSDQVKEPVAVRFAWEDTAEPNFINSAGLPASPFRTDEWPGKTDANF